MHVEQGNSAYKVLLLPSVAAVFFDCSLDPFRGAPWPLVKCCVASMLWGDDLVQ